MAPMSGLLATTTSALHLIDVLRVTAGLAFAWLPFVFGAYALGRRKIGLRFLFVIIAAEAAALALADYLFPELFRRF